MNEKAQHFFFPNVLMAHSPQRIESTDASRPENRGEKELKKMLK